MSSIPQPPHAESTRRAESPHRTERPYFDGVTFHERRRAPRRPVSGAITAVVCEGDDATGPHRICSLEMTDISDTGLGAISRDILPTGATIALFMPPHGSEPGLDRRGTIVRCRQRSDGHEVGIDFDTPHRAA